MSCHLAILALTDTVSCDLHFEWFYRYSDHLNIPNIDYNLFWEAIHEISWVETHASYPF